MIKPSDILYSLRHFDCARDIRTSTWKNDNPNKAEKYHILRKKNFCYDVKQSLSL